MTLVLGKARSHRAPNLGCSGAESPGLFDVSPKISEWDMMHEWAHWCDEAANHQLPVAEAFWIIWIVSLEERPSLTQNLMQISCSIHSVILNALATQYTCSLNSVYCSHWLVQWHNHFSCMHIPVHSHWQTEYINVVQTVLIMLTMAGLFPDRPCILFAWGQSFKELSMGRNYRKVKGNWGSMIIIINYSCGLYISKYTI